jgi:hypothetical protein
VRLYRESVWLQAKNAGLDLVAVRAQLEFDEQETEPLVELEVSVLDAGLAIDAAIFSQDSFKRAAEAYAAGYNDAYVAHLNDALDKTTQVRGHEEGAYRDTEKLNSVRWVPGATGMLSNFAKKDQEVLIMKAVPAEAIKRIR